MVSSISKFYCFEYVWEVPQWSRWLGLGLFTSRDAGLTPAWEIDSTMCAVSPPGEKKLQNPPRLYFYETPLCTISKFLTES